MTKLKKEEKKTEEQKNSTKFFFGVLKVLITVNYHGK
jgi:hypothetical protein